MSLALRVCRVCGRIEVLIRERWVTKKYSDGKSYTIHRHQWRKA